MSFVATGCTSHTFDRQPAEPAEPAEPTKSAAPAEPAQPAEPAEPVEPADRSGCAYISPDEPAKPDILLEFRRTNAVYSCVFLAAGCTSQKSDRPKHLLFIRSLGLIEPPAATTAHVIDSLMQPINLFHIVTAG